MFRFNFGKKMKTVFITVLLIFGIEISFAQSHLLDSVSLALEPEYTDLAEALKNPDNVIRLSLRKKKYKSFPIEILQLRNIQYLDISKNKIKELPDSIVVLKNLQYLIVSRTGLEALPKTIGGLKNLIHLNVNQNELQVLPYSFGDLEKLEVADLWSNNLDYFPESMTKLKNLRWMDLRNILIPAVHQENIQNMLPDTKINFSPACNCAW
jgi:Leucine-rich repeat (LRR) protein